MPKKPAKNAYFYFMLEYKKQLEEQGTLVGMEKVSQMASVDWQVNLKSFKVYLQFINIFSFLYLANDS